MKKVNFGTNFTTTISGFFQYDYGQLIDVYNVGTNIPNLQFEFIQNGQQITVLGEYVAETDSYIVRIPDTFLQNPEEILTYIYYEDPEKGQTIKILIVKISTREKYESIPDPEHHSIVEQILEELEHLQDEIDNWTISQEQLDAIIEEVKSEIDLDDYYTKTEVDNLIPDVSDLATKQELTNGLATKANSADVYSKSETYTKTEVNNLIPDVSGLATKQELTNGLATKANSADVYTKSEVDSELDSLGNDFSTILYDSTDENYYVNYLKNTFYTKSEIDATIGNIQTLLEAI